LSARIIGARAEWRPVTGMSRTAPSPGGASPKLDESLQISLLRLGQFFHDNFSLSHTGQYEHSQTLVWHSFGISFYFLLVLLLPLRRSFNVVPSRNGARGLATQYHVTRGDGTWFSGLPLASKCAISRLITSAIPANPWGLDPLLLFTKDPVIPVQLESRRPPERP
jgi:hypothetical protein